MIIFIHSENPQQRLINQVVEHMQKGAIICYPTDTGYGVGCDLFNQKAVKKLIQLKKRPKNKPFSFICSDDLKDISKYAHVSNTAYRLLKRSLPGAYTFVLPGTKLVPNTMVTKQKTVGIRVPDHPICQQLVLTLGNPVVTTSLPIENQDYMPIESYEIDQLLGKTIDVLIDGGPICPDPSSIIDLTGESPEVLRVGKGDVTPFQ